MYNYQFIRYTISGIITFAVYIAIYLVLSNILNISYGTSAFVAYATATLVNYLAQGIFTFSYTGNHTRAVVRYLLLLCANGTLNVVAMSILPNLLRIPHEIIQIIVLTIIVVVSYLGQKLWVFRS